MINPPGSPSSPPPFDKGGHGGISVLGYPVNTRGPAYLPKTALAVQNLFAWRQSNSDHAQAWLIDEIGRGLQRLMLLRLDGAPAAELVVATAEMWLEIIGEGLEEVVDRDRIRDAFAQVMRKSRKWPQPADLLKAMPPRGKYQDNAAMEAPISDEQHAKNAAELRKMTEMFGGKV